MVIFHPDPEAERERAREAKWNVDQKRLDDMLKPKLTPEFLGTLIVAARTLGWDCDLIEIDGFVNELRYRAGLPALTPEEHEPFNPVDGPVDVEAAVREAEAYFEDPAVRKTMRERDAQEGTTDADTTQDD